MTDWHDQLAVATERLVMERVADHYLQIAGWWHVPDDPFDLAGWRALDPFAPPASDWPLTSARWNAWPNPLNPPVFQFGSRRAGKHFWWERVQERLMFLRYFDHHLPQAERAATVPRRNWVADYYDRKQLPWRKRLDGALSDSRVYWQLY